LTLVSWIYCQQNTNVAGSEHCEHARVSVGLVPLTLKLQFLTHQ